MTYNQAIKRFNYSGRKTLRTLFDYLSHEWTYTLTEEKANILKELISEKYSLQYYLDEYIQFYTKELYNKAYVVQAIPQSIDIIIRNCKDEDFKNFLSNQYDSFMKNSKLNTEYELKVPDFIKKMVVL